MGFSDGNTGFSMPVVPAYGNNGMNDGFGFGGGMGAWWLLVLLFAMGGWNNNNNCNNDVLPYLLMNNNSNSTNSDVQRGFDQQAVISGINGIQGSVTNGFAGVQQSLCNGFAGVEAGATNRQMANMQTMFGLQQQLSQCCCDNRLATAQTQALVQSENCEDRNALNNGIRDILLNQNNNTQKILDVMCQDKIDAKNEKIAELQQQLNFANLRASQTAQTSTILADNAAQTAALEQYLNPPARPAYVVPNPNGCNCGYNYDGCCN